MMALQNGRMIILLAFVAHAHANELAVSHIADAQEVMDKLVNRADKMGHFHYADLDNGMLGKSGHLVMPSRTCTHALRKFGHFASPPRTSPLNSWCGRYSGGAAYFLQGVPRRRIDCNICASSAATPLDNLQAAGFSIPSALTEFLELRQQQGDTLVDGPADPRLHPLFVPLTRTSDGHQLGVLAMPPGISNEMLLPVVSADPSMPVVVSAGSAFQLLARDLSAYMARHNFEQSRKVKSKADRIELLKSKEYRIELLRAAGLQPDVMREHSIEFHRNKDTTACLVGAARCADYHRGWASGEWWHVMLLREMLDREAEAVDIAFSMTQKCPIWSLPSASEIASYPADVVSQGKEKPVLEDLAEMLSASAQNEILRGSGVQLLQKMYEERYKKEWKEEIQKGQMKETEKALKQAMALMDAVAVGSAWDRATGQFVESSQELESWDSVRPRLAELFTKAGYPQFSMLVCP